MIYYNDITNYFKENYYAEESNSNEPAVLPLATNSKNELLALPLVRKTSKKAYFFTSGLQPLIRENFINIKINSNVYVWAVRSNR